MWNGPWSVNEDRPGAHRAPGRDVPSLSPITNKKASQPGAMAETHWRFRRPSDSGERTAKTPSRCLQRQDSLSGKDIPEFPPFNSQGCDCLTRSPTENQKNWNKICSKQVFSLVTRPVSDRWERETCTGIVFVLGNVRGPWRERVTSLKHESSVSEHQVAAVAP
jgi:hypothetical protein